MKSPAVAENGTAANSNCPCDHSPSEPSASHELQSVSLTGLYTAPLSICPSDQISSSFIALPSDRAHAAPSHGRVILPIHLATRRSCETDRVQRDETGHSSTEKRNPESSVARRLETRTASMRLCRSSSASYRRAFATSP